MLRTMDGKRVEDMLKEFDRLIEEADYNEYHRLKLHFELDGSTSEYKGHEIDRVEVDITSIYVTLKCYKNTIKLPNMCRTTLPSMIERAAEILLFENGVKVEY